MAGGGKSTQQQDQTYTDNRAVLGQGSNDANNGSTITNYVVDNGTVNDAFQFAAWSQANSGKTLSDAIAGALGFAGDAQAGALSTVGDTVRSALNFGSDAQASNDAAVSGAFGFGRSALNSVDQANAGANSTVLSALAGLLNFGSDAQASADSSRAGALAFGRSALDFAGDAQASAYDATTNALNRVLDQTASTQQLVADAYENAKGQGAMTGKLLVVVVVGMALVAYAAVKK